MDDPIFRPIIFPKTKMKTNLPLTGYERGRLQQQRTFTEVTPVTAAWLLPMLSEKLYWWQIAGVALIGAGIWLLFQAPSTPPAN